MNRNQILNTARHIGSVALASVFALALGGLFLWSQGCSPLNAYEVMFSKALHSIDQVLRRMTPLMLTGLAVAIPQKTAMINLGGEGQIAIGGLIAALVGAYVILPFGIHPIVSIILAAAAGGAVAWLAAYLRVKFGAVEVVTTIMINYLITYALSYLTMYQLRASDNLQQTATILKTAQIAQPIQGQQWSWGLLVAIGICVAAKLFMDRTTVGLELKAAGLSPMTAKFQGVNINKMATLSMVIGGAMAGIGGSLEVLGGKHAYVHEYFINYGWDGVAISYMANGNPLGIIVTSFLISILLVGAISLDRRTGVSIYFSVALQGIIIIFMVSPYLITLIGEKFRALLPRKNEDVVREK